MKILHTKKRVVNATRRCDLGALNTFYEILLYWSVVFFFALLKFVFFIGRLIDKNLSWKGLSCIILFGYMYLLLIFFWIKN